MQVSAPHADTPAGKLSKSPASGGGAKRFADLGVHRLILNPPTRADQAELLSYVAQAERDLTGKV